MTSFTSPSILKSSFAKNGGYFGFKDIRIYLFLPFSFSIFIFLIKASSLLTQTTILLLSASLALLLLSIISFSVFFNFLIFCKYILAYFLSSPSKEFLYKVLNSFIWSSILFNCSSPTLVFSTITFPVSTFSPLTTLPTECFNNACWFSGVSSSLPVRTEMLRFFVVGYRKILSCDTGRRKSFLCMGSEFHSPTFLCWDRQGKNLWCSYLLLLI